MKERDGSTIENWWDAFFDFLDRRYIVRRLMTIGTFIVTLQVIYWALNYASVSPRNGTDIAAILAAIMVPINGLMGFMFTQYVKGGPNDGEVKVLASPLPGVPAAPAVPAQSASVVVNAAPIVPAAGAAPLIVESSGRTVG